MKRCPRCEQTKPFEAFAIQRKSKDGRYPYCRECASAKTRRMYAERGRASWLGDKTCSWCQVLKPRTEFRSVGGKVVARCISCETEIAARQAEHLKRCNICREWLPHDRFHPSKVKYENVACRDCTIAQRNQPDYKLRRRNYTLQKEYGITLGQYKELLEKQGHKCPICLVPFEPGNYSYHVDHAHRGPLVGTIRAILHDECNRSVMWMHHDSAQLRRAADLIDQPLTNWIVPNPTWNERRREKERQK